MVAGIPPERDPRSPIVVPVEMAEQDLRWSSISMREVLKRDVLLKAAVFDIEGRHARETLEECRWPLTTLAGEHGMAEAFHRPRFKRLWVEKSDLPIHQPGQIGELNPRPAGYISPLTKTDIEALRVTKGQILLTCSGRSGSIGRAAFVSQTLDGRIFSHDLIRISCQDSNDSGYMYAFLRTQTGRTLIRSNEYGAMIPHIEPFHLETVPIPNPPHELKQRIGDLVCHSYALRDESNALLDEAEQLLIQALELPPLPELHPQYFDRSAEVRNYTVALSTLAGRLDGSYHAPIVGAIVQQLRAGAAEVTSIGDPRISRRIILPGRFARVYVGEGQGVPFFGGKGLYDLDPAKKKYLSLAHHADRIREQLTLRENMVLITCSGTIGKVTLVPRHWEKWTANQHIIRVQPTSREMAGYIYVFLATEYGRELIRRFTYGAVVDEIDDRHVAAVPIPFLKDLAVQREIGRLALDANAKRAEAYYVEQSAIRAVNEDVIHAKLDG